MAGGGQPEYQNCTGLWFSSCIQNEPSPHIALLKAKRKTIEKGRTHGGSGRYSLSTYRYHPENAERGDGIAGNIITIVINVHQCVLYPLGNGIVGDEIFTRFLLAYPGSDTHLHCLC